MNLQRQQREYIAYYLRHYMGDPVYKLFLSLRGGRRPRVCVSDLNQF